MQQSKLPLTSDQTPSGNPNAKKLGQDVLVKTIDAFESIVNVFERSLLAPRSAPAEIAKMASKPAAYSQPST